MSSGRARRSSSRARTSVVAPGDVFRVGREGDLVIDDNLFLHRHFLTIENIEGLWLLSNVGSRLRGDGHRLGEPRAGVARARGAASARVRVDLRDLQRRSDDLRADDPHRGADVPRDAAVRRRGRPEHDRRGAAHAEPARHDPRARRAAASPRRHRHERAADIRAGRRAASDGRSRASTASSTTSATSSTASACRACAAASRSYATNRRARLVEHAIAARLVTREDLPLLDRELQSQPPADDADD